VPSHPKNQPSVVVIGLDCITGLQIARALHGAGVRVTGLANNPEHIATRTRCVSDVRIVEWNSQSLLTCLRGLATPDRPVLMSATDTAVALIAQHGDELSTLFRLANPQATSIERALGKVSFAAHSEQHGIPIPKTRKIESLGDIHRAGEELAAPYVLKPNIKSQSWDDFAGGKVLRAADSDELVQIYQRSQDWCDSFVVQEWVEGDDDAMYSYYSFIDEERRIVADCVGHKIRQWPRLTGSGTLSEIYDDPEILETGRSLLESLEHRGFATVNMKRDVDTGRLFVIEANVGRPGMGMFIAEAAGIDMTYLAYRSLVGLPMLPAPQIRYPNARWISLKRDFAAAVAGWRQGQLSLGAYLRSMRRVRRRAVFAVRDPLPFLYDVLRSPGQVYRRRS
jgi:predicted ATP-grasp superfamily ATP-dependent carboligase